MSAPLWSPGTLKQPGDLVRPTSAGAVTPQGPDNPYFDDGATGWTFSGDGNAVINTASPVFNGAYSLKANDTGGNNQKVATNNARLPVTPGQIVTIRCYVQCTGDADRTRIQPRINWYTAGAVLISPSVLATDPSIIGDGFVRVTPGLGNSGGLVGLAAVGVWVLLEVTGVAPPDSATWTPAVAFNWGPDGAWACDYFTWEYASQEAPNNNLYRAVQAAAGFTANIEPDWPTTIGQTIVDNEVTWECVSGNSVTWQAHRILVSGLVEPNWPLVVNAAVADNTIAWSLNPRRVIDEHVPQSKIGMLAAKKIFSPDGDIINFSATVNPLDWSTIDDAGFLPFGLNVYGANPVAAMGLYRGNIAAFNSQGCQIWQVSEDPAQMALLDAVPLPCTYPRSLAPVGDDLVFLTDRGIRSLALAGSSINLQSGYFGKAIDPLVTASIKDVIASGYEPLALYWPAQGQYWLFFDNVAYVLTINGPDKQQKSWSRYTFPWTIDHWTILGTSLYLRAGDLVEKVDLEALQDDLHTEVSPYFDLNLSTQYDSPGFALGDSTITLDATQDYDNTTPVILLGGPVPFPIMFVTAQTVAGGDTTSAIHVSFDNGATWASIPATAGVGFRGAAFSRARAEVLFLNIGGAIAKTTDMATSSVVTNDIGNGTWHDMVRSPDDTHYVACGQDPVDTAHRIARSADGISWARVAAPNLNYERLQIIGSRIWATSLSSSTTQPLAYSDDQGATWTAINNMGVTLPADNIVRTGEGRYIFTSRSALEAMWSTDLTVFNLQSSLFANGVTALVYASTAGRVIAATAGGLYTTQATGVPLWTSRAGVTPYQFAEDLLQSVRGDVIGVRTVTGSQTTPAIIRTSNGGNSWANLDPGWAPSAVYTRIYEYLTDFVGAFNTELFSQTTISGDKADTSVTASHIVIAPAGASLVVKYPMDPAGPFTLVDADLGDFFVVLSAPLSVYADKYTVLRITYGAGDVEWNYLETDAEIGDTFIRLVFPLTHEPTEIRIFPKGSTFLNDGDITVSYVPLAIATDGFGTSVALVDELPADATGLEAIIRPYQLTAVAGGQGTSTVILDDVATVENDASNTPEAGFPSALVFIGPYIEFTTGEDFDGVMQWPFLDLNNFNGEKELQAFDLSIDGFATVSFGWDQRQLEFDDNPTTGTWTVPYQIIGDTVPGSALPFSLTGASFAMRLVFPSGQAWKWYSANMYVKDVDS